MMQNEKINPKMIALAREARGYSQADLADLSGVSRPSITRLEQGDLHLNEGFIKNMTEVLKFSESLYSLDAEPLPTAIYRRRENVPAKLMNKVDAMINVYTLGIGRLLRAIQFDKLVVPSFPTTPTEGANRSAMLTRRVWNLKDGVITNLTSVLEEKGFITLPVDFETERIDSRGVLIDDKYPVIFYNKKLLGDRLRFTLAYELGHIIMHTRNPLTRFDDSKEANEFAAEFLMPKKEITKDLDEKLDLDRLAELKSKWLVSMHALLYRAEDLNVITENQKRYVINRFNHLKIRRREPKELDVPIERGQLLRDLITKYRSKQKMNVKEIADFFYMKEEEFLATFS
jgi:Zn-dependent peptidase ImmA (M78 family)/DNA-binding XRE family transcriptional regulator